MAQSTLNKKKEIEAHTGFITFIIIIIYKTLLVSS